MSLIRYVTRIHFANRAMEEALPEEMRARGLAAPLILADADAGEALPRLLDSLPPGARPRVVEIGTGPAGPHLAEADGEGRDLVIGLGGAQAIDGARIIRLIRAPGPMPQKPVPRMAVPTLPGCMGLGAVRAGPPPRDITGSAAAPVPCVLFCDPTLLQLVPRDRLAAAGMDGLVHCLEALVSTAWNPPADGMAFDGLRRAGQWLERLVADPAGPEARCEVMAAALNGALAAQKGLGAVHAMAHAFEALVPEAGRHGALHAAFIGPALAFNAPAVPDRIAQAADALRLQAGGDLAAHLQELGARLGLPVRLGHLGLTAAGIARIAERAAEDAANRTNPRHATARDYRAMLDAML